MSQHFQLRDRIPLTTKEASERAGAAVAQWNTLYPEGTPVRVYRLRGDESTAIDTTTTSQAFIAGKISAAVMVHGLSGPHYLTHVKPLIGQAESRLEEAEHNLGMVLHLGHALGAVIADEMESGVAR